MPRIEDRSGRNVRVDPDSEALRVTLYDTAGNAAYDDEGALVTIDYAHHEIHDGNHYIASQAVDLGNGASRQVAIVTGANEVHVLFSVITEAEGDFTLYEGATWDAPGTGIAEINRKRSSTNTATMAVYYTPTSAATGSATLLQTKHWGSGKTTGADVRSSNEFILKASTNYLFTITNDTTSNNFITWWLDWYEE